MKVAPNEKSVGGRAEVKCQTLEGLKTTVPPHAQQAFPDLTPELPETLNAPHLALQLPTNNCPLENWAIITRLRHSSFSIYAADHRSGVIKLYSLNYQTPSARYFCLLSSFSPTLPGCPVAAGVRSLQLLCLLYW
jgi:hypothetical protein